MPTCFIIQPFDDAKYDKRFDDIFSKAIGEAGLEPYRVDRDPSVGVLIEGIEEGINNAAVCFAEITTDNPNVWYELGYAFATGQRVVMVCSDERPKNSYPFDIRHRKVIDYKSESPRDFDQLKLEVKQRLEALMQTEVNLRQFAESEAVTPREGLTQSELAVLAVVAGDSLAPEDSTSVFSIKHELNKSGFSSVGAAIGLRRLLGKKFIESMIAEYEDGQSWSTTKLTDAGWDFVLENEDLFSVKKMVLAADKFHEDIQF